MIFHIQVALVAGAVAFVVWQLIIRAITCPFCGVRINTYGTNHDEYCDRYHNKH